MNTRQGEPQINTDLRRSGIPKLGSQLGEIYLGASALICGWTLLFSFAPIRVDSRPFAVIFAFFRGYSIPV